MMAAFPARAKTLLIVSIQSALLFITMQLIFVPFANAPRLLGPVSGYLIYSLYPLLLYLLLVSAHKVFNRLAITNLGFAWRHLPAGIATGFLIGTLAALVSVTLLALCVPEVFLEFSRQSSTFKELGFLLANVWQTAFSEEFLFRGYLLLTLLHRGMRKHSVVIWSALIFAGIHFTVKPAWWLFSTAAAGILLGSLYISHANIWAPVGCHLAINLVFGLINRDIVLQLNGAENHLFALMVSQCVVYLVIARFAMFFHRQPLQAGTLKSNSGTLPSDESQT
ncbi:MAG: type II CAAX endopeptidase family protein [Anaerolineae bacterium]|jgi:membrane protease YdiL (CAAX protease family)|nr:type II CAAX endopeptidase family protein [Anaerolineae bacterium]